MTPAWLRFAACITAALALGCAADETTTPACEGKCDDARLDQEVAQCWTEPTGPVDAPAEFVAIRCRPVDGASYQLREISLRDARLAQAAHVFASADEIATIGRVEVATGFPIELTVEVVAREAAALPTELPSSLRARITLARPDDAPAPAPLRVRLPFHIGTLTVDSTLTGSLEIAYDLDLAPFQTADGEPTLALRHEASLTRGLRTRLAMVSDGRPLTARVNQATYPVPSAGHVRLTDLGFSPVAPARGIAILRCGATLSATPEHHRITCQRVPSALVQFVDLTLAVAGATPIALPPSEPDAAIDLGDVADTAFPVALAASTQLWPMGTSELDPAASQRTFHATGSLTLTDDGSVDLRLELDLWAATVSCEAELCLLDREAWLLPTNAPFQWAVPIADYNLLALDRDVTQTLIVATPTDTPSIAGTTTVLGDGDATDHPHTLGPGSYRLDATGLHPQP